MKENIKAPKTIWTHWIHFLACGFGSGASPWAPGTMGTLVAIPIYLLLVRLPLSGYLMVTLVTFVAGVWLCEITARDFGVHDHAAIVWDEIVGFFITMTGLPHTIKWILLGFFLFRLFDIWKPWPIKWVDAKVKGGLGIMLDDVIAAVFALIILHIIAILMGLPIF